MEPTSAALTEDTQAIPAAHSVALAKTYGVGQAAVHALAEAGLWPGPPSAADPPPSG